MNLHMIDLNRPPMNEEDFIMATKATTAKAAEKKVEVTTAAKAETTKATVKKEEVKATKTVEVKAEAKKVEAKPAAKVETKKAETKTAAKATAKVETKPAAKAAVKAEEKKAEPKKTAAKKTTTKKAAAKKEKNVLVQFAGMEFDTAAIEKAVKADYTAKNGKKTMTSVSIYIKPEDMKAYYVIDGIIGDVAL